MAKWNRFLTRTVRFTGWPLLALMLLYLVTGYVLCGRVNLGRWFTVQTALGVHRLFDLPLVLFFVAHSAPAVYLAFVRWGWIRGNNKV